MKKNSETIKVHMIANAHLDPVWLWSWQAGVDEVLATAHTTVKVLKEYPQVFFTRSDVWFHEIVEKMNPELFKEIAELIAKGQWQLVGGWYVQPDCNLPTEFGFLKHIEFGKKYFGSKFNEEVTIGYNVDSFGHAGSLPKILAQAGYKYYIYMRPGSHEKEYPCDSQVFWWQASDSEHKLLTYRIPVAYCCNPENLDEHIQKTIEASDTSLGHIMCFFGVGDHGGGPTREQIEFICHNRKKYDGFELIFSHPRKYFESISDMADKLPIVKGELQHHAVGCYSVLHQLKKAIKLTEHKLVQAQDLIAFLSEYVSSDVDEILEQSWEDVLFSQFHDTHGGTCLKSAYTDIYAKLGRAWANADDIVTETVRKYSASFKGLKIGDLRLGYFAVMNSSLKEFDGWVEHELFSLADKDFKVLDFNTLEEVPIQRIASESIACSFARILMPIKLGAHETKIFAIEKGSQGQEDTDIRVYREGNSNCIANTYWNVSCSKGNRDKIEFTNVMKRMLVNLQFCVYDDSTDTWSHNVLRLGEKELSKFNQTEMLIGEAGRLRAKLFGMSQFDKSQIRTESCLYRYDKWLELKVKVIWNQPLSVLKMNISFDDEITGRIDGIPGGVQNRELDGKEYPFSDWTILKTKNASIAIISPDIFGFDVQKENVRFTLVRSPAYAHHHPTELGVHRFVYEFTDIGEHEYRILIGCDDNFDFSQLTQVAYQMQQSVIHWDPAYREGV